MTQVVHEVSQALLFLFVQEIIIVHLQDVQCYKEAVHTSLEFFLFPHCLPQKVLPTLSKTLCPVTSLSYSDLTLLFEKHVTENILYSKQKTEAPSSFCSQF